MCLGKVKKIVIILIIIVILMWGYIVCIHPIMVAAAQGDDWVQVCKATMAMRINGDDVVQMSQEPISFIEKGDGGLNLYLEEKGNITSHYAPEFMTCKYITEEGKEIRLVGRKCTAKYTIWYEEID